MKYILDLIFDDGSKVPEGKVKIRSNKEEKTAFSSQRGRVEFELVGDWINQIEFNGEVVARDISLRGTFGPKEIVEVRLTKPQSLTKAAKKTFTFCYTDGEAVSNKEISFFNERGEELKARLSDKGKVSIPWDDSQIARVEIEQRIVKQNWNLSGLFGTKKELDLVVPRPGDQDRINLDQIRAQNKNALLAGIHGRLFYHDGTKVRNSFKVEVELDSGGVRGDTSRPPSYCKENGEFFIATDSYSRATNVRRFYVKEGIVSKNNWWMTADRFYIILMPDGLGRGHGSGGGVIAGQVVGSSGTPLTNAKVEARVRSSSFLSSAPPALARTDDHGRFALIFEGGVEIKELYINGRSPQRIINSRDEEIAADKIRAGSFGLVIVSSGGLFS